MYYLLRDIPATSGLVQLKIKGDRKLPVELADSERPLPKIYHSGYLTIKDFRQQINTFQLDFPNDEVKRCFVFLVDGRQVAER